MSKIHGIVNYIIRNFNRKWIKSDKTWTIVAFNDADKCRKSMYNNCQNFHVLYNINMNDTPAEQTNPLPVLTERELEIFKKLRAGATPKEIAFDLKIAHGTFLTHQGNLYRKLDVHTINELLTKYSSIALPEIKPPINKYAGAVFNHWYTIADDLGSSISGGLNFEEIQGCYNNTYTICGNVSDKDDAYIGLAAYPDPSTLEAIKKARVICFTALGDGNIYEATIITAKGEADEDYSFHGKNFITEKGEISTFSFNIDEISQSHLYGNDAPFIKDNIEAFYIRCFSAGDFKLKIWDVKIFF